MLNFIARRIAVWVPTVLLILLGVYALAFFGAGDPVKLMFLRAPGDVAYDPVRVEAIREAAGLNRPFIEQFWSYVLNLLSGNWGNSLVSGRPVWNIIAAAAPVSAQLAIVTVVLTTVIAVPLGIVAALNQNGRLDYAVMAIALAIRSVPAYVAGPLLMIALITVIPGARLQYGWGGVFDTRIILPLVCLSMAPISLITRLTRSAVIEVLSEDYVRTAKAKGVPQLALIRKHLLRPVLTPVVTELGIVLIHIVNGAIYVETVFGLPGLGRLTVQSTVDADYPVILAITLIGAVLVMVANLVVELTYPLLDPRASHQQSSR